MKHKPIHLLPWLIGTAGLLLAVLFIWRVPQWQLPSGINDLKERAELENANRGNVLGVIQTLGGLGFIGTAYLAWRNYRLTEDKHVAERFKDAVQMLGDNKMEVRLGGIYSLERIAKDSPEDHWTVMDVLTAFVREKSSKRDGTQLARERFRSGQPKPNSQESDIETDVQAALMVIGRREIGNDSLHRPLDLNGANISGVQLSKDFLSGANLCGANLSKSTLCATNLSNSFLISTNLCEAALLGADLSGALLAGANLSDANLSGADLVGADLSRVLLYSTDLKEIRWNEGTKWNEIKGLDTAQNVPEALKQQLGLSPSPEQPKQPEEKPQEPKQPEKGTPQ